MSEPKWYVVNKHGLAAPCEDRQNADACAAEYAEKFPGVAPYRAAQLVEVTGGGIGRDDVLRMAREAGGAHFGHDESAHIMTPEVLERFATMAAASALSNIKPTAQPEQKPEGMTDEGWRQLTEVIPFRIHQVKNGCFMSLQVLMESIDKIAEQVGLQEEVHQGLWHPERAARQAAQAENAELKERLAHAGIEQRRAVLAERDAWRKGLSPAFRERMGAEQVLEIVQSTIRAMDAP